MALRLRSLSTCLLLLALGVSSARCPAQRAATSSSGGSTGSQTVTGRTIDAVSGLPIARALVHCGSQAMLTDYEGRFQCAVEGTSVFLTAVKPGYYASQDPSEVGAVTTSLPAAGPVDLRLYPEALLTGTLTAPDGEPLPNINVQPRRSYYDETGHHWTQTGSTRTDSHGEFRLPVVPGDYSLETTYAPAFGLRTQAVLPLRVPDDSSSGSSGVIHARAGETQHFDLHPTLVPVVSMTVRLEPEYDRNNVRIRVIAANGTEIFLRQTPSAVPGELKMEVPRGTYLLQATRELGPDGSDVGETRITVGDRPLNGVLLRLTSVSPIPVEISIDSSVGSSSTTTSDNTPPNIALLGLSLENLQPGTDSRGGFGDRPIGRGTQLAVFNPAPGTYRLHARVGGPWFIRSATYGTSDLLRQNLVVTAGSGTVPIRLIVSNQGANLTGTVRTGGQPVAAWIYFLSTTPSATPLQIVRTNTDGTYTRSNLAPGGYRAVAIEHRAAVDLEDPAVLAAISSGVRSVSLNAGDKATLDLELTPAPEVR